MSTRQVNKTRMINVICDDLVRMVRLRPTASTEPSDANVRTANVPISEGPD